MMTITHKAWEDDFFGCSTRGIRISTVEMQYARSTRQGCAGHLESWLLVWGLDVHDLVDGVAVPGNISVPIAGKWGEIKQKHGRFASWLQFLVQCWQNNMKHNQAEDQAEVLNNLTTEARTKASRQSKDFCWVSCWFIACSLSKPKCHPLSRAPMVLVAPQNGPVVLHGSCLSSDWFPCCFHECWLCKIHFSNLDDKVQQSYDLR